MTHRASDIETLAAAVEQLRRYGHWNSSSPMVSHFSSVVIIGSAAESDRRVLIGRGSIRLRHLVAHRHRARDRHPRAAAVGKKIQGRLGAHFHLPDHIGKNFPRLIGAFFSAKTEHGHAGRQQ